MGRFLKEGGGWGGGIKGLRPTRRTVWGRGAEAKGG